MLGTRMTWDEMVNEYPDMWVVVANPLMDGDSPDILEGDVVNVLSDDDIGEFEVQNFGKGYKYRRTTEGYFNGITGSSIVISVD